MNLISIFGLMGNVVALIVLSRPSMKGSFSSLLIGKSLPIECFEIKSARVDNTNFLAAYYIDKCMVMG